MRTIEIDLKADRANVTVRLTNSGVIPKEIRSRFFEKYTTRGKKAGTGVGTFVAKLVAEAHKGSIDFETLNEEKTCLVVILPKAQ